MTALTQGRDTPRQNTELLSLPVAANTTIHAGALVCVNAQGFAVPGTEAADLVCVGRAQEGVANAGSNGDESVSVRRHCAFKWANDATDPVTSAQRMRLCYIVDDQTVSASHETNTRSVAGVVVGLDADGVWVEVY